MDNRADGTGNPFERPYFGDSNLMRQQMAATYGMHPTPHALSPHHVPPQQMFPGLGRRPSYTTSDAQDNGLSANQRSNPLPSPSSLTPLGTTAASPWMLSYSPPNVMNPEYHMSMPSMFQSRWAQEQSSLMSSQHRDPLLFSSQFRQESALHAMHQREAQLQRDRELQMQREQEAQLQREQKQREQDLQLERERDAQLQLQREREALLHRKREAQMQQERDAQIQRHRQEQLDREAKEQAQRELMFLHQANQFQHTSNSSLQHRNAMMHPHFNFQQDMNIIQNRTSMPSLPNYSPQNPDMSKPSLNIPFSMPALSKESVVNTSQIHFPQISSSGVSLSDQQMNMSHSLSSLSGISNLLKRNPSLEENLIGTFDANFRDRNLYDQQPAGQIRNLDDIDLTIDRHLSAIQLDNQKQAFSNENPYSSTKPSTVPAIPRFADVLNDQKLHKSGGIHTFQSKESTSHDAVLSFNSFSISQIKDNKNDQINTTIMPEMPSLHADTPHQTPLNEQQKPPQQQSTFTQQKLDAAAVSFSQSNTVQVTQNSSVNINININMPSHPSFPFGLSDLPTSVSSSNLKGPIFVSKKDVPERQIQKSAVIQKNNNPNLHKDTTEINPDAGSVVAAVHHVTSANGLVTKPQSVDNLSSKSNATSIVHSRQKSKQSFSSIETFLGISSSSARATTVVNESAILSTSSLELARSAKETQDRISVIKPVSTAQEENDEKTIKKSSKKDFNSSEKHEHAVPVHPSMRIKKTKKIEHVDQLKHEEETIVKKNEIHPVHPSMRLKINATTVKSPTESDKGGNCLSAKSVRYQSEVANLSSQNINKKPETPTRGKPANFIVSGGKPANFSALGGKPASYSSSFAGKRKNSTPTGGKPLSYLKSICDNKPEVKDTSDSEKKNVTPRRRSKASQQPKKQKHDINEKATTAETKTIPQEDNEKVLLPTLPPQAVIAQKKPVKQEKKAPVRTSSPTVKSSAIKKKNVEDKNASGGKPFQFKSITFDADADKESSDSDSDTSSDSEDDETQDSDQESMSEDDLDTTVDSAVSQDSAVSIGKKRKATTDSSDVIATLKKRKVVDENLIKVPLAFGWRRQTRLRPVSTGEGLRGDVYYYSPCGKKLRTYPELNSYMLKNPNADVKLENFSFSTKLNVGEFLEARQGSKFEPLTDEQVIEQFEVMKEKARLSKERTAEKRKQKTMKLQKAKKLQEERQKKKDELQMMKKQKEDERRKAVQEKALEAKQKKEKEKEAAIKARQMKEDERLMKKLEKKAALEASQIAKRDREEEKKKIKESREKERLQKLEQQRLEKEWKQQALENEREKRRQEMVMSKAQEKEQRRREIIMMKAYEAQRRADERERLKEQKRLEKTIMRQRKQEQKRFEKMISRELKKPIDDMALNDLKPLPQLVPVVNLNIPGQAYADLLMVQEFVHSFGHVIDIDVEEDFPSLADLQASLLCEPSSEDALFNACQQLLFFALYDPGVSGKYASTALGTNLQNVELNEANISDVLRLFILCRNDGKSTELSDLLFDKPIVSLSPVKKAAILAFLCNELLCGKAIGREIESSLENMSNLRRDKWTLEGQMRKLKVDIVKKKPKTSNGTEKKPIKTNAAQCQGNQDEESRAEDEKDSEEEKDSDDEDVSQVSCANQDDEEDEADSEADIVDPQNIDQMEKKLIQMEKKHTKFRSKLFDSSHTIRGIHLGQDRYKRRYFVLPNAGGIYVEGLESGYFDEEMSDKTEFEKEQTKEKIGSLLTTLKSPTLTSRAGVSVEHVITSIVKTEVSPTHTDASTMVQKENLHLVIIKTCDNSNSELREVDQNTDQKVNIDLNKHNVGKVIVDTSSKASPHSKTSPNVSSKKTMLKWFSLKTKQKCDDPKSSNTFDKQLSPKLTYKLNDIVPPKLKTLSEDHMFLESIYKYYSHTNNTDAKFSQFPTYINPSSCPVNTSSLFGLPPDLDINLLIQQDPQKAAELLEIQTAVPQDIPNEMKQGWWRIIDPELLQRVTKSAHLRGMRERSLQRTVTRYSDYAAKSCKLNDPKFSLELPDEDTENKDDIKSPIAKESGFIIDQWFPALAYASDKAVLIEVEELEEKVFSASLQMKGYHLSQKLSSSLQLDTSKEYKPDDDNRPLHLATAKLLALEAGIERRYLKHPFRIEKLQVSKSESVDTSKDDNLINSNIQAITPALKLWREAITDATSAAQLSMCVNMLNNCIAWDKSIMKVFCILCRKSDNEERLLLCDACDRGCHTYCCKPRLDIIPDGDWFCQECILMASGSDQCYTCKGKTGKRQKCAFCPRHYHLNCLDPPLQKTPRYPWACPVCKKARSKTKPQPRKHPRVEELARKEESAKGKSPNNRQQSYKDMEPCRLMLTELENHDLAWPFLVPVNGKQFPEYYKVIRRPMDFHTMKTKLRDYSYKSREEFVQDARRVFINCNTFNEDESEVGRAGKAMARFFASRWPEIVEKISNEKRIQDKADKQFNTSMEKRDDDSSDDDDSSSSDEVSSESESSEVEESDDETTKNTV